MMTERRDNAPALAWSCANERCILIVLSPLPLICLFFQVPLWDLSGLTVGWPAGDGRRLTAYQLVCIPVFGSRSVVHGTVLYRLSCFRVLRDSVWNILYSIQRFFAVHPDSDKLNEERQLSGVHKNCRSLRYGLYTYSLSCRQQRLRCTLIPTCL